MEFRCLLDKRLSIFFYKEALASLPGSQAIEMQKTPGTPVQSRCNLIKMSPHKNKGKCTGLPYFPVGFPASEAFLFFFLFSLRSLADVAVFLVVCINQSSWVFAHTIEHRKPNTAPWHPLFVPPSGNVEGSSPFFRSSHVMTKAFECKVQHPLFG